MGKNFRNKHSLAPRDLTKNFSVLQKCTNKFDCLLYEMFFVQELRPTLNVQSNSIRVIQISDLTLQVVNWKLLVWLVVEEFQTAASPPHRIIVLGIYPLMLDWMEVTEVGHPRVILILPTTCRLTFCMSMLSVLLLLKELMVLMSGQQSIRFAYQWMVPLWSPTKKTMLTG